MCSQLRLIMMEVLIATVLCTVECCCLERLFWNPIQRFKHVCGRLRHDSSRFSVSMAFTYQNTDLSARREMSRMVESRIWSVLLYVLNDFVSRGMKRMSEARICKPRASN